MAVARGRRYTYQEILNLDSTDVVIAQDLKDGGPDKMGSVAALALQGIDLADEWWYAYEVKHVGGRRKSEMTDPVDHDDVPTETIEATDGWVVPTH